MDNDTTQLQATINTPVTNSIPDVNIPTDLASADLTQLTNSFNDAASGLNNMGEALTEDVSARQQLLIGNNFGPSSGSAVGDLNYDTYYEQGLAQGSNAIRKAGTKIALTEGMRRAQEEAKKRAEKAQKDYNARVNAANAAAAAAAANNSAQSQAQSQGEVQGVQISKEKLNKYGVDSMADLERQNPEAFQKELRLAADAAAGIGNDNVWKWRTPDWYANVDAIYKQFGATAEERKDERSGNQTAASKKFWARKDVGSAFNQMAVSRAGYSKTYYADRNAWVDNVQKNVSKLMESGGTIDQINNQLNSLTFEVKRSDVGNNNAANTAKMYKRMAIDSKNFDSAMLKLTGEERAELAQIDADFKALGQKAKGPNSQDSDASYIFQQEKYADGAVGAYNRALELIGKSGINVSKTSSGIIDTKHTDTGIPGVKDTGLKVYDPVKKGGQTTITLKGADAVRDLMGLRAEDIAGIHKWKTEDRAGFDRAMRISQMAQMNPIVMSDGTLEDADGNVIPRGTTVVYSFAGNEQLPSYSDLTEALKKKPVVYNDGTGQYGWADLDGIQDLYDKYTADVSAQMNSNMLYFQAAEAGTGKGSAIVVARDKSRKGWSKDNESKVLKYSFGGVKFRDAKTNDDIVTRYGKLSPDKQRNVIEGLVARSEYDRQGEQTRLKSKGAFHGVVNDDISKDEAADLLIVLHSEMSQVDSDGKHSGLIKPAGVPLTAVGKGAASSSQNFVNFLAGSAYGLFTVPLDAIDKINGNASKQGYVSHSQKGREIAEGGDGKGLATFADGYIAETRDVQEEENMFIFSGFSKYRKGRGWAMAAGELGEFAITTGLTLGASAGFKAATIAGSKVVGKLTSRAGAKNITSVLAKPAVGALDVSTMYGGGMLRGVTLESNTLDIVGAALPKSMKNTESMVSKAVSESLGITNKVPIRGNAVTRAVRSASQTVDEFTMAAMQALRESHPEAFFKSLRLSPVESIMFKNASRAQLTAAGATDAAFDASSRMTRATAVAMYNTGTPAARKAAANLINHADEMTKAGYRFTADDGFRFAAKHVGTAGTGLPKTMNTLAHESKWSAGYIGWEFTTETGSHEYGRWADYLDADGKFDFTKAYNYQTGNIIGDIVAGTIGYGMLGPGMRAIKNSMYNRKLDHWTHVMEQSEDHSKRQIKAYQKVVKYSEKANKFSNESAAKFINDGNSAEFKELANKADIAAARVIEEITQKVNLPMPEGADKVRVRMEDLIAGVDGKISYNRMYTNMIMALKVRSKDNFNRLTSELPIMSALDGDSSIRMMADIQRAIKGLPANSTDAAYREAEIKGVKTFAKRSGADAEGLAREMKILRKMYGESESTLRDAINSGLVSAGTADGTFKHRKGYFSAAGILSPGKSNIPLQYTGINIAAGISGSPKASMQRDSLDFAELIFSLERRVDGLDPKIGRKKLGIYAGENVTLDTVNMKVLNPVHNLHAYNNKIKSDIAIGQMREARFARLDVVKRVADEDFDANFAIDQKYAKSANRAMRNSKQYKELVEEVKKRLTFDAKGASKLLSTEATGARAEAFVNNLVRGVVGPTEIQFLKKITSVKYGINTASRSGQESIARKVDDFLKDYTALHINANDYIKVYTQVSTDRATDSFVKMTGRQPNKAELDALGAEINETILGAYAYETPHKRPSTAQHSDAPITMKKIAKAETDSMYLSPAEIYRKMEDAKQLYLNVAESSSEIIVDFSNTSFNEQLLNSLDMMDSKKLVGKEYKLNDLVRNDERFHEILVTAPKELKAKIASALDDAVVIFKGTKDMNPGAHGSTTPFDVRKGDKIIISLDAATIRRDVDGSIRATLGHELVHVLDYLDFDKYGYDWMTKEVARPYHAQKLEGRAHAYGTLQRATEGLNQSIDSWDKALRWNEGKLADIVAAADKAGVKLDYKKALEEIGESSVPPVYRHENGITYIRASEFDASKLGAQYESLRGGMIKGKDDSVIMRETAEYMENHARLLEGSGGGVQGELFLDKEYSAMVRTYDAEGGDPFKEGGRLAKLGELSNEIQQLQLAAGYSIWNAYTSRQFSSAFGAMMWKSPADALKLLKTYSFASSTEAVRKYISDPSRAQFLNQLSMVTGDSKFLDALMDTMATQPSARTGVLDDMAERMKEGISQGAADGKYLRGAGKGTIDAIHRVVDDPTFKRFMPILMLETMHLSYLRKVGKKGRHLNPNIAAGDEPLNEQILKEVYEDWEMFWGLHGPKHNKGDGVMKFNQDKQSKYLTGQADNSVTMGSILGKIFFALPYRLTQMSRFLNGLVDSGQRVRGVVAGKGIGGEITANESLLYSGIAMVGLAMGWNYLAYDENVFADIAAGIDRGDPNDLYRLLVDFGSMGRIKIGDDDTYLDPFFSIFTLQNSVAKEALSIYNVFAPPKARFAGAQDIGQELSSLLLSPIKSFLESTGITKTYYGYSVHGKNASAIDPETDEPIEYSPLDNVIAGVGHFLGLDTWGFGANLTYDSKGVLTPIGIGKNAKGERIGGGGLLQHEYIDMVTALFDGDIFGALSSGLELPIRVRNRGGEAKVAMNGWLKNGGESAYREYKDKIKNGNLTVEEKDAEYNKFAKELADLVGIWNQRYKILDDRPEQMLAAQRMIMGFLSDEWNDSEKRIVSAYRAAGIDALGGFDRKPDETEEEYEERKARVQSAYGAQLDKEYAARKVLESIGFDVGGYDYEDAKTKQNKDREHINFQFKKLVEGEIAGQTNLKTTYRDYSERIRQARAAKDYSGAKALEAEYMSVYESVVAPYIQKYGAGILLRNKDFTEIAKDYVIIPSADYKRYSGENGKKYWLQDRYGVGYKNGESLISDSNYVDAYQRLIRETISGNSAAALVKAQDMMMKVAQGKYTVTDEQYNKLVQLFSKLRQNAK